MSLGEQVRKYAGSIAVVASFAGCLGLAMYDATRPVEAATKVVKSIERVGHLREAQSFKTHDVRAYFYGIEGCVNFGGDVWDTSIKPGDRVNLTYVSRISGTEGYSIKKCEDKRARASH